MIEKVFCRALNQNSGLAIHLRILDYPRNRSQIISSDSAYMGSRRPDAGRRTPDAGRTDTCVDSKYHLFVLKFASNQKLLFHDPPQCDQGTSIGEGIVAIARS